MSRFVALNQENSLDISERPLALRNTEKEEAECRRLYEEAITLQRDGHLDLAEQTYRRLLSSPLYDDPNIASLPTLQRLRYVTLKNLSDLENRTGRIAESLEHLVEAVELFDEDPMVWFKLGCAARSLDRLGLARVALVTSLARQPLHWLTLIQLTEVLYLLGDYDEAEALIKNVGFKMDSNWPLGHGILKRIESENSKNAPSDENYAPQHPKIASVVSPRTKLQMQQHIHRISKRKVRPDSDEIDTVQSIVDKLVESRTKRHKLMESVQHDEINVVLSAATWTDLGQQLLNQAKQLATSPNPSLSLFSPIHIEIVAPVPPPPPAPAMEVDAIQIGDDVLPRSQEQEKVDGMELNQQKARQEEFVMPEIRPPAPDFMDVDAEAADIFGEISTALPDVDMVQDHPEHLISQQPPHEEANQPVESPPNNANTNIVDPAPAEPAEEVPEPADGEQAESSENSESEPEEEEGGEAEAETALSGRRGRSRRASMGAAEASAAAIAAEEDVDAMDVDTGPAASAGARKVIPPSPEEIKSRLEAIIHLILQSGNDEVSSLMSKKSESNLSAAAQAERLAAETKGLEFCEANFGPSESEDVLAFLGSQCRATHFLSVLTRFISKISSMFSIQWGSQLVSIYLDLITLLADLSIDDLPQHCWLTASELEISLAHKLGLAASLVENAGALHQHNEHLARFSSKALEASTTATVDDIAITNASITRVRTLWLQLHLKKRISPEEEQKRQQEALKEQRENEKKHLKRLLKSPDSESSSSSDSEDEDEQEKPPEVSIEDIILKKQEQLVEILQSLNAVLEAEFADTTLELVNCDSNRVISLEQVKMLLYEMQSRHRMLSAKSSFEREDYATVASDLGPLVREDSIYETVGIKKTDIFELLSLRRKALSRLPENNKQEQLLCILAQIKLVNQELELLTHEVAEDAASFLDGLIKDQTFVLDRLTFQSNADRHIMITSLKRSQKICLELINSLCSLAASEDDLLKISLLGALLVYLMRIEARWKYYKNISEFLESLHAFLAHRKVCTCGRGLFLRTYVSFTKELVDKMKQNLETERLMEEQDKASVAPTDKSSSNADRRRREEALAELHEARMAKLRVLLVDVPLEECSYYRVYRLETLRRECLCCLFNVELFIAGENVDTSTIKSHRLQAEEVINEAERAAAKEAGDANAQEATKKLHENRRREHQRQAHLHRIIPAQIKTEADWAIAYWALEMLAAPVEDILRPRSKKATQQITATWLYLLYHCIGESALRFTDLSKINMAERAKEFDRFLDGEVANLAPKQTVNPVFDTLFFTTGKLLNVSDTEGKPMASFLAQLWLNPHHAESWQELVKHFSDLHRNMLFGNEALLCPTSEKEIAQNATFAKICSQFGYRAVKCTEQLLESWGDNNPEANILAAHYTIGSNLFFLYKTIESGPASRMDQQIQARAEDLLVRAAKSFIITTQQEKSKWYHFYMAAKVCQTLLNRQARNGGSELEYDQHGLKVSVVSLLEFAIEALSRHDSSPVTRANRLTEPNFLVQASRLKIATRLWQSPALFQSHPELVAKTLQLLETSIPTVRKKLHPTHAEALRKARPVTITLEDGSGPQEPELREKLLSIFSSAILGLHHCVLENSTHAKPTATMAHFFAAGPKSFRDDQRAYFYLVPLFLLKDKDSKYKLWNVHFEESPVPEIPRPGKTFALCRKAGRLFVDILVRSEPMTALAFFIHKMKNCKDQTAPPAPPSADIILDATTKLMSRLAEAWKTVALNPNAAKYEECEALFKAAIATYRTCTDVLTASPQATASFENLVMGIYKLTHSISPKNSPFKTSSPLSSMNDVLAWAGLRFPDAMQMPKKTDPFASEPKKRRKRGAKAAAAASTAPEAAPEPTAPPAAAAPEPTPEEPQFDPVTGKKKRKKKQKRVWNGPRRVSTRGKAGDATPDANQAAEAEEHSDNEDGNDGPAGDDQEEQQPLETKSDTPAEPMEAVEPDALNTTRESNPAVPPLEADEALETDEVLLL